MRLVTSCPACDTQFHVQREQLVAHAGTVRCGQCQHVFDAGDSLYEILEPQALIPLPVPLASETHPDQPPPVSDIIIQDDVLPGDAAPVDHSNPAEEIPLAESFAESIALDEQVPEEPAVNADTSIEIDQGESVDTEIAASVASDIDSSASAAQGEYVIEPPLAELGPIAEASFLNTEPTVQKRRISPWITIPLSLLLVSSMLAQLTFLYRSELANHWPATRPTLVSACEWLGCTVALARNSELLALDDSDLQEDFERPEVIQLATKLLNNASYTQAYPLLELTLTDEDDQPKLRRIFTPEEYLPTGTEIAAGMPAHQEIQINLSFTTQGEPVSGYRVFVTY